MIALRHPDQLSARYENITTGILINGLSSTLQQRFQALSEDGVYQADRHGYIVIAEPGDDVGMLEAEIGSPLLSDWFGDSHFGDDDFAPTFDHIENQPICYELTFSMTDGAFTMVLIVPKQTGIDAQLLSLCRENGH